MEKIKNLKSVKIYNVLKYIYKSIVLLIFFFLRRKINEKEKNIFIIKLYPIYLSIPYIIIFILY